MTITVSPVLAARNKIGLPLAQFAMLLGVSVYTLQDWEHGKIPNPFAGIYSIRNNPEKESEIKLDSSFEIAPYLNNP
jgi:DNA-binding transcriptional regulator YiaG